jgi:hypothetical protein
MEQITLENAHTGHEELSSNPLMI